jgi:guanosine-3',5'-bis(diphosphate) 3'-pyrophosphohydrolase
VNSLESKQDALAKLLVEIATAPKMPVYQYLYSLRTRCQLLASIVHMGQVDKAGKPYTHHVKRLASKAEHIVLFCALILHDVIEEGKELEITLEFLKEKLMLPQVIVDIIGCLTRGEFETYPEYVKRIMANYMAQKGKVVDNSDNSDISRFDNPNRQDVLRCTRYLEKAQYIKSSPGFQQSLKYDIIHDMIALHQVSTLAHDFTDRVTTKEKIEQTFYFGYPEQGERSYVIHFDATIDQETRKTTATISTYPSRRELADWMIWKPRRQIVEFETDMHARDYLHNWGILFNTNGFIVTRECLEAFRNPGLTTVREEDFFATALTKHYA